MGNEEAFDDAGGHLSSAYSPLSHAEKVLRKPSCSGSRWTTCTGVKTHASEDQEGGGYID